jgi:hypothetical protein
LLIPPAKDYYIRIHGALAVKFTSSSHAPACGATCGQTPKDGK